MMKPPKDLEELIAQERARGRLRLDRFLQDRYELLAAAKVDLTWSQFARVVAAAGAISARGRAPTEAAIRKAWLTLERSRQASQWRRAKS